MDSTVSMNAEASTDLVERHARGRADAEASLQELLEEAYANGYAKGRALLAEEEARFAGRLEGMTWGPYHQKYCTICLGHLKEGKKCHITCLSLFVF